MLLEGKTALVTGAAGGIGSAVSRAVAREGARLALVDIQPADTLAEDLRQAGAEVEVFQADATSKSAALDVIGRVNDAHGLDILVNIAGVASLGPAATLPEEEWDRVLNANLKSVFLWSQAAIAPMRARKAGRIVSISSVLAKNGGNPRPWLDASEQEKGGNLAYGASKAGINAVTYYLARELAGDNITVNAVAPGPVTSAMTATFPDTLKAAIPLGRMGTGEDVAEAVVFLASERASWITGEVLDVNGGMWGD